MIHASNFTVILDACVLYPAPIRDLLLSFAAADFFRPQWTREIESEWTRNLLKNRPDLEEALPKTVQQMAMAFPDSCVTGYESLIASVELPDLNDRHVVAAAIKAGAEIIVTLNLNDFPAAQWSSPCDATASLPIVLNPLLEP